MSKETTLKPGQTWHPANGERPRQIQEYRAAGLTDNSFPMGQAIVLWASSSDKWGWCLSTSFRSWIRRTGATLHA